MKNNPVTDNKWTGILSDFVIYLRLERALADNTRYAYLRDINGFLDFLKDRQIAAGDTMPGPRDITGIHIQDYLASVTGKGISPRTQARQLSALKTFFTFLLTEKYIKHSPCTTVAAPKTGRRLPVVLSLTEIENIIDSIDLSQNEGHRNMAIIEMLYGCGLRVSELTTLKLTDYFPDEGFIRVIGKGNKQRLVPVGSHAVHALELYFPWRNKLNIHPNATDYMFLNRYGRPLSRNMVFIMIKEQTGKAGIKKIISPHTFRHSFATHMIENGADLRVVQEMLGHCSILTTEIYTHIDKAHWQQSILSHHPRR